ncbi:hypothetical protein Patl1_16661 [Pistacia atlantica]|uniref:Uncharacterized protein n=1 Tax=Pistacia atlantica TaxID=434234 RepID=A0ACC1B636_9ROSI|nr:hypothetical protein Patl1_16661 [Pistacia atlantica]
MGVMLMMVVRMTGMRVVKGIAYERFMEDLRRTINKDANICPLEIKVLLPLEREKRVHSQVHRTHIG